MSKKTMIDYIEQSGMVRNFSRNYFNKMLKERVEKFYNMAVDYNSRKENKK